jgi:hypothetical protein
VEKFKPNQEVVGTVWIERRWQGEYGWDLSFQQGIHRFILAGIQSGRSEEEAEEDATWEVLAAWANFEPCPGQDNVQSMVLYFPEACTHFFEGHEAILPNLST